MKNIDDLDKEAEKLEEAEKKSYSTNHAEKILGGKDAAKTADKPVEREKKSEEEKKKSYGFSIQNSLMAEFNKIIKDNRMNKSIVVEDFIREFVKQHHENN